MSLGFNFSLWYSSNALKIQYYYMDLIELQNAPLTYSLWAQGAKSSPVKILEPPNRGVIVKVVRNAQKRVVPEEPRNFSAKTQWDKLLESF